MESPEFLPAQGDPRRHAPATARNRDPILHLLRQSLPTTGTCLEIASGTGEHAIYFAPQLPDHHWLPSDPSPAALTSIQAWRQTHPAPNLAPPLALDVTHPTWVEAVEAYRAEVGWPPIRAIAAINLLHIAPWSAAQGLFTGAATLLPPGGIVFLYGPYYQEGIPPAPSNQAFDARLRAENPQWGIRTVEAVTALAPGFEPPEIFPMPANNLSLIFTRR